jgi:hypothetical protein
VAWVVALVVVVAAGCASDCRVFDVLVAVEFAVALVTALAWSASPDWLVTSGAFWNGVCLVAVADCPA